MAGPADLRNIYPRYSRIPWQKSTVFTANTVANRWYSELWSHAGRPACDVYVSNTVDTAQNSRREVNFTIGVLEYPNTRVEVAALLQSVLL